MKYDYKDAVGRIIRGYNGHLLTENDTVYRFPDQVSCNKAEQQLQHELPEVRLFKSNNILVTTLPQT